MTLNEIHGKPYPVAHVPAPLGYNPKRTKEWKDRLEGLSPEKRETIPCHEEDAVVWLWASPELLPPSINAEWLFSPVCSELEGDIWGIDATGQLVIIENKGPAVDDPFASFCRIETALMQGGAGDNPSDKQSIKLILNPDKLSDKWNRRYRREFEGPNALSFRPEGRKESVLPNSSHRAAMHRWWPCSQMARERIDPKNALGRRYKATIESALEKRKEFTKTVLAKTVRYGGLQLEGHEDADTSNYQKLLDLTGDPSRVFYLRAKAILNTWSESEISVWCTSPPKTALRTAKT